MSFSFNLRMPAKPNRKRRKHSSAGKPSPPASSQPDSTENSRAVPPLVIFAPETEEEALQRKEYYQRAHRYLARTFFSRFAIMDVDEIAGLAEQGDDGALTELWLLADRSTFHLTRLAELLPESIKRIARGKAHWPVFCGPRADKTQRERIDALIQRIDLAKNYGKRGFTTAENDRQRAWLKPIINFVDTVRRQYALPDNPRGSPEIYGHDAATAERISLQSGLFLAIAISGTLPFTVPSVQKFDLILAKRFADLPPLTKASARTWQGVIRDFAKAHLVNVEDLPAFKKTIQSRTATKDFKKGTSSYSRHAEDAVFKRVLEILQADAPPAGL
jgi:hypothetical protein